MSETYMNFPMEGLGLDDYDRVVEWLDTYRDQVLWHQMACGLFMETPRSFDYLLWIVQQSDCDRATAAAALIHSTGYLCLFDDELSDERAMPIAETVCAAAARGSYERSEFADPSPLLETDLAVVRRRIESGRLARRNEGRDLRFAPPAALFERDYPAVPFIPRYLIEQDFIVRIDSLDERSRRILDL